MPQTGTVDFDQLRDLARKAQAGDAAAYERFLEQLYGFVRRVLRAKLGQIDALEDLTQDCLIGVHKSLQTYDPTRSIKPWLDAIVRYKIADHFRANARRRELPVPEETMDVTKTALPTNDTEEGGPAEGVDIRALVKRLPPALRTAVVLTRFEGLSGAQAAEKEGISPAALRKRVSRAYKRLAQVIESDVD